MIYSFLFSMFNFLKLSNSSTPKKINFYKENGYKFIREMPVKSNSEVFYLSSMPENSYGTASTLVCDKTGRIVGTHTYHMGKHDSQCFGHYIEVPDIKDRGKGVGEVLRLASIAEMKENNMNKMNISSYSEAIPFHLKYKFKPDINDTFDVVELLEDILTTENISKANKTYANKLLLEYVNAEKKPKAQINVLSKMNDFIENYVKDNSSQWQNVRFLQNVPMSLDNATIKQNKSFFDNLYKKHGIDYTV